MLKITHNKSLLSKIGTRLELRDPNKAALEAIVSQMSDHNDSFNEMVCDLATGVGKTYILAGLIEYLAEQGARNILIMTPGKTVQRKTVENFTIGHSRSIKNLSVDPVIVTPKNFKRGEIGDALHNKDQLKLFIFNVHQFTEPNESDSKGTYEINEYIGSGLYEHLKGLDDLYVVADEHHTYNKSAEKFSGAVRGLNARALVGLTATPDEGDKDKIIFQYSLAEAIAAGYVKVPTVTFRSDGRRDEDVQLADACLVLEAKEQKYQEFCDQNTKHKRVKPLLFVVCKDVADAKRISARLSEKDFLGDEESVLCITNDATMAENERLENVEDPRSTVRAIVSVNILREGWDVKSVGVLLAFRALASETLTEQVMGRGLRLPFGERVGVPLIDQLDIIAHESYVELLKSKGSLLKSLMPTESERATAITVMPEIEEDEEQSGEQTGSKLGIFLPQVPSKPYPVDVPVDLNDGEEFGSLPPEAFRRTEETAVTVFQNMDEVQDSLEKAVHPVTRTQGIDPVWFPRLVHELSEANFQLSDIQSVDLQMKGRLFSKNLRDIFLKRQSIEVSETLDITNKDQETLEAAVYAPLSVETVRARLAKAVSMNKAVYNNHNDPAVKRVVREFLIGAGVTDNSVKHEGWTERRMSDAAKGIGEVIGSTVKKQADTRVAKWDVRLVTPEELSRPTQEIIDYRYASKDIKKNAYNGWSKSATTVVQFDAKSTEYELAKIFDTSSAIQSWFRLNLSYEVSIDTEDGRGYYPDFIVVAKDGTHYLVEGKSDDATISRKVKNDRKAAQKWMNRVESEEPFEGCPVWQYLFVTEAHIKSANGSWEVIKDYGSVQIGSDE
jgi:type III restriction enzyme